MISITQSITKGFHLVTEVPEFVYPILIKKKYCNSQIVRSVYFNLNAHTLLLWTTAIVNNIIQVCVISSFQKMFLLPEKKQWL